VFCHAEEVYFQYFYDEPYQFDAAKPTVGKHIFGFEAVLKGSFKHFHCAFWFRLFIFGDTLGIFPVFFGMLIFLLCFCHAIVALFAWFAMQ
jgi:hypothetical protein